MVSKGPFKIDKEALAAVAKIYDTDNDEDTINSALRDLVVRERRLAAFDQLGEMARAGDFDHLLDKRNYRP